MKARFFPSLAFVVLFSACTVQRPETLLPTADDRPGIKIYAPVERVRISIITQQTGERAAILASASENRLTFATQVSRPDAEVLYDLKPSGAPYVRTTYILAREARATRVSVRSEIVNNYGTAFERAQPLDSGSIRQTQQRDLLRLQAIVEKR